MDANPIPALLADFLDLVTGGALAYASGSPYGDATRADAAARMVSRGDVERTQYPGVYLVRSDEKRRAFYRVDVDAEFLSCECDDHLRRAPHVCKHIVAAAMVHALMSVEEPSPVDAFEDEVDVLFGVPAHA